ncbi:serine--tRNA ligase [Streptomyces sp. S6]
MHDARELLALGDKAVAQLARRGYVLPLEELEGLHRERTGAAQEADSARAELKQATKGAVTEEARAVARALRERVQQAESRLRSAQEELTQLLLSVPNIPLNEVPDGRTEAEAVEVRRCGPPPAPADKDRHHAAVGASLGILDGDRAAKLSGARFSVAWGAGARLERALADLLLDLHTGTHGYTEYSVPYLVTRETMTGTGQLPKFEKELFSTRVGERELMLIPTGEVPLTNLFAGEVLDEARLPLAVTARTPCFRAEAGSYGRDTRGILRLHQFEKVELVRLCAADDARRELELMVSQVEECLRVLELSYRVVLLPAGDLGFSARMTYDLEVWLPGSGAFREISSVSDCGDFQARRANIRRRGQGSRKTPVVTLNGSALPIGRTVAAILEQHVRPDGSVRLPKALVPYAGFERILPGGVTTA